MKLITPKTLAAEAPQKFSAQYSGYRFVSVENQAMVQALNALPQPPTPKQVNQIIGNDSWTDPGFCNECGKRSKALVEIGQSREYDSRTAYVCRKCLEKALKLFVS